MADSKENYWWNLGSKRVNKKEPSRETLWKRDIIIIITIIIIIIAIIIIIICIIIIIVIIIIMIIIIKFGANYLPNWFSAIGKQNWKNHLQFNLTFYTRLSIIFVRSFTVAMIVLLIQGKNLYFVFWPFIIS